ncbi:MAG: energy-coupling factor transporter ATPase [Candidatus Howiella sp.]|jgi:energy-coupling factor transport system ATP-binding protein
MDEIIKVEDVTFSYSDEEDAPRTLEHFNISIERGSFTAILGHNGSGKSTLAKLFNGLNRPQKGRVLVDGMETADEKLDIAIHQKVGMVFQNPDNQLVATVVEEDVAFGPENLGLAPEEIRRRVDDALRTVGMYAYKDHAPHKLSGGQKQRVAIAGIIAMEPDCIVLDEPTAMLDPRGRRDVIETIHRLNREKGITILLITHYMDEAAGADRVVVMDKGEILLDGAPREVFSQVEAVKATGLDLPQPTELLYRLRQKGVDLPDGVIDTDECIDILAGILAK